MYEPTLNEIDDKADELYQEALNDNDILIDALINNIDFVRNLLNANLSDSHDAKLDLEIATIQHIYNLLDLKNKALAILVAEHGVTVRTDVDTFKTRVHETRY